MGFLSGIISTAVKTALTPVAIAKDVINVVTDDEVDATKKLTESAIEDLQDSLEDLADGDL